MKMLDVFAVIGAINWSYYVISARDLDCFYVLFRIIHTHIADIKHIFQSNKVSRLNFMLQFFSPHEMNNADRYLIQK